MNDELTITLDPEEAGRIAALLGLTETEDVLERLYGEVDRWLEHEHPDERHRWTVFADIGPGEAEAEGLRFEPAAKEGNGL